MKSSRPLIGLLGGIGAGKSAAAACFSRLGCGVIDADRIAHEVLNQPDVIRRIADCFGADILSHTGSVDRKRLAAKVFVCRENLDALAGIVHPLVLTRCEEMLEQFWQDPSIQGVILDMPLLVEVGWDKRCDVLVFIDCCPSIRSQRTAFKGLDDQQQKKRENFQISLDKKKKMATFIIDNNSDESELAKQVEIVFSAIRDRR